MATEREGMKEDITKEKTVESEESIEIKETKEYYETYSVNVDGRDIHLAGLTDINVILGRIGCGKSRLLQALHEKLGSKELADVIGMYIPPERGVRPKLEKSKALDQPESSEVLKSPGPPGFSGPPVSEVGPSRHRRPLVRMLIPHVTGPPGPPPKIEEQIAGEELIIPNILKKSTRRTKNEDLDFRKIMLNSSSKYLELDLELFKKRFRESYKGQISEQEIKEEAEKEIKKYVDDINPILKNVEVEINTSSKFCLKFYSKDRHEPVTFEELSSGENELIFIWLTLLYLRIELYNAYDKPKLPREKGRVLLLIDEPDAHLHPDAQREVAELIFKMSQSFSISRTRFPKRIQVILVTHSTSILGSLSEKPGVSVCFMKKEEQNLKFIPLGDGPGINSNQTILGAALPIFGAHPLTQAFNEKPILLVEGQDEDWIWQRAIRHSDGKLKVYPCYVRGKGSIPEYENLVSRVIGSIYDNPKAYSLIDKDKGDKIKKEPSPNVKRFILNCRNSESLLLSDEVLDYYGITFEKIKQKIDSWIKQGQDKSPELQAFKESGYDRQFFDIKPIVELLVYLIKSISPRGFTKYGSWQASVGKIIGNLVSGKRSQRFTKHSIIEYLGIELGTELYPDPDIIAKRQICNIVHKVAHETNQQNIEAFSKDINSRMVNNWAIAQQSGGEVDIREIVRLSLEETIRQIPDEFPDIKEFFESKKKELLAEIIAQIQSNQGAAVAVASTVRPVFGTVESVEFKTQAEVKNVRETLQRAGILESSIQTGTKSDSVGGLPHLIITVFNNSELELVKKILGNDLQPVPLELSQSLLGESSRSDLPRSNPIFSQSTTRSGKELKLESEVEQTPLFLTIQKALAVCNLNVTFRSKKTSDIFISAVYSDIEKQLTEGVESVNFSTAVDFALKNPEINVPTQAVRSLVIKALNKDPKVIQDAFRKRGPGQPPLLPEQPALPGRPVVAPRSSVSLSSPPPVTSRGRLFSDGSSVSRGGPSPGFGGRGGPSSEFGPQVSQKGMPGRLPSRPQTTSTSPKVTSPPPSAPSRPSATLTALGRGGPFKTGRGGRSITTAQTLHKEHYPPLQQQAGPPPSEIPPPLPKNQGGNFSNSKPTKLGS